MYIGLIFASGLVLGAFADRLYNASSVISKQRPNPEEFRKKIVAEYESRLKLSPDQLQKLNVILDETHTRVEETRRSMRPALQRIHDDQVAKILEILNPDQKAEYEKMRKEREERQKQSGRGL